MRHADDTGAAKAMNSSDFGLLEVKYRRRRVIVWVVWGAFLLVFLCLFLFSNAIKSDVYFERYYAHHSMDIVTKLVITNTIWIIVLPLLWLPFIIRCQRRGNPKSKILLLLPATMFVASLIVVFLIFYAGPPFQM
jgi:hypothetical protein